MNRMQFTAAVVKCALRSPSPSGLADVREELKATTRKAQHTPKTLDSLGGMIITFPLPSVLLLAAVERVEITDRRTGRRLQREVAADSLFKQGAAGGDRGRKERRRPSDRDRERESEGPIKKASATPAASSGGTGGRHGRRDEMGISKCMSCLHHALDNICLTRVAKLVRK